MNRELIYSFLFGYRSLTMTHTKFFKKKYVSKIQKIQLLNILFANKLLLSVKIYNIHLMLSL